MNREVEIRRGQGSGHGERTDSHVDAVVRGPGGQVYDSVLAIIEVKGCWNDKLDQAMRTQLVDRHLQDNRCQRDLYLVRWFNCNQWDNSDDRKRQAKQVADFVAFLKFRARVDRMPVLDEARLAALHDEFAEEDRKLAAEGMLDYAEGLEREDTQ